MAKDKRCVDCGLLAVRHVLDRTLCEVEEGFRQTSIVPKAFSGTNMYEPFPTCFVQAHPIRSKLKGCPPQKIAKILSTYIKCDDYLPWQQGHTPKEHLEMQMLKEQRGWQRHITEEDNNWRKKRAEEDNNWREKQAKEDRDWRERQEEKQRQATIQEKERHRQATIQDREWRKEDVEIASNNLKAARGNVKAVWCGVAIALIVAVGSLGISIWSSWHTSSPVATSTKN